jgi:copper homeostasis protein
MLLEVCAFNIQSCIIAERVGAQRAELCDNPLEGGTTPSYGTIRRTREKISIALYPIIRPRAGYYFYSEDEFAIMMHDILMCKQLHCDGISIGVHNQNGEIDMERLKRIVDAAYPMGVTCNRAFDSTPDPSKALEDLIACGCERVLTSGQKTAAPDGADLLAQLVKQADGRIIIMPGAGVRSSNIEKLITETGATEFHTSARMPVPDKMKNPNPAVSDTGNLYLANEEELKKILDILTSTTIRENSF